MSDSLAVFRKSFGDDLGKLAQLHYEHDLQQTDRDQLQSAAKTVSQFASVGSVLGLALGALLAYRLRANRTKAFAAFRAAERPTQVTFANGRTEQLPDLAPLLRPSTLGDVATYTFFMGGGLFIGGETGLLTGGFTVRRRINGDPESRARIETAFRKFRADALRTQANLLDQGKGDIFA